MPRLIPFLACLAAAACRRAPPPQSRFCDEDLSGLWLNSSDRHFAYRFREDAGVIQGDYLRREDDGGLAIPAEPITFELRRTAEAVSGVMRTKGESPGGRACPVEFETRVSDCKPDSLQVVVEVSTAVGEDCKRAPAEDGGIAPRDLREFRFERAGQP
jgi:hypothetical protein